jgi:uncharacterized protein (TIGR02147 family)
MPEIFQFQDYKEFTNTFITAQERSGRGIFKKIAEHLRISNVVVSQIFSGQKDLSLEQALLLCQFFNFTEVETEYFLHLVNYARASHFSLKEYYLKRIIILQERSKDLKEHLQDYEAINDEARQVFYSDWSYSAICLVSDLPSVKNEEDIAKHLKLPLKKVYQKVQFLLKYGLVKFEKNDIQMGKAFTFIDKTSPLLQNHRKNWRLLGFEKMEDPENLFFVFPMTLSKEMTEQVKGKIIDFIKDTLRDLESSPSEETACLNIDFFRF